MSKQLLLTSLLFISFALNANEVNDELCISKNRKSVDFNPVKNLDKKTQQQYSKDIMITNIDIDNDGTIETVYKIKWSMRGVKCWGTLYSFNPHNALLKKDTLNITDFHRLADYEVRELGNKKYKSNRSLHKEYFTFKECKIFEPFIYKNKTYVTADNVVFKISEDNGNISIESYCK